MPGTGTTTADTIEALSEATRLLLESWTALRLAVENSPYTPHEDPVKELQRHLVDYFVAPGAPDAHELEDQFGEYFLGQLDCEVEDGSTACISRDLVAMHASIIAGQSVQVLAALRQQCAKAAQLTASQVVRDGDYSSSDGESSDDVSSIDVDEEQPTPGKQELAVDEDGFTLVTKKHGKCHQ